MIWRNKERELPRIEKLVNVEVAVGRGIDTQIENQLTLKQVVALHKKVSQAIMWWVSLESFRHSLFGFISQMIICLTCIPHPTRFGIWMSSSSHTTPFTALQFSPICIFLFYFNLLDTRTKEAAL